jgi:hypothetical protein
VRGKFWLEATISMVIDDGVDVDVDVDDDENEQN